MPQNNQEDSNEIDSQVRLSAVLTLSALNFAPSLASAQDEAELQLPHEVHWQNAVVPAEITGSRYRPWARREMLTLTKTTASQASFIMFARTLKLSRLPRQHASKSVEVRYKLRSALWTPQFEVTRTSRARKLREGSGECATASAASSAIALGAPGADLPQILLPVFLC